MLDRFSLFFRKRSGKWDVCENSESEKRTFRKIERRLFGGVLSIVIGLGLLDGCGKKDAPVTKAEQKDKDKPGIAG